jgi:integrase
MSKANYKNEIIKRSFFKFLKDSGRFADNSVQSFESALLYWEDFTKGEDLQSFNGDKALAFRDWLKSKKKQRSEQSISLSYSYDILRRLRKFFEWLSEQPKSKLNKTHIGMLSLSRGDTQIATRSRLVEIPTLDEVLLVLNSISGATEVEKRDRALIALTLLTGARISAISSLSVRHFDRRRLILDQDPATGVKTKFSKHIVTKLFGLPSEKPLEYFLEWYDYLITERGFTVNDPLFPATKREQGKENVNYYSTGKVEKDHWNGSAPARKIFEKCFKGAGSQYYHPHTFRHLIVKEYLKVRLTEEEKKAISQNLGHEDVATTFGSYGYGKISTDRQIELLKTIPLVVAETESVITGMSDKELKRLAQLLGKELAGSQE